MLRTDDLYEEIETIEAVIQSEKDAYRKALLKGIVLLLKLTHNTRTNTMQVMKHFKIDGVKPKAKDGVSEKV